ncbi:rhomboid family intramembrane serine protease [Flavobacterium sp.]|uniref:rhomboid family intramembrane serine protease n=1 Tax=Flavobacterium sp. TaxID=239 RepID=UPI003D6A4C08
MTEIGIIGLLLIIANVVFSYKGFSNGLLFDSYKFEVDKILINKDYKRLITSGFLHVSWSHLIFNMLSLYAFSGLLELQVGWFYFALIYFASLIGGDLLALYIHRNHGDYSSVGASGAICGIIFASIALFPGLGIGFFGIPFSIPSWLYGLLYVAYSIYGIKSNKDNIGHEAHLGGALIGMLIAIAINPNAIVVNYLSILIIFIPTLIFVVLIVKKPHILLVDNFYFKTHKKHYNIDHKYNEQKANEKKEIDKILDKISSKGIDRLTKKEKEKLDEYSK